MTVITCGNCALYIDSYVAVRQVGFLTPLMLMSNGGERFKSFAQGQGLVKVTKQVSL